MTRVNALGVALAIVLGHLAALLVAAPTETDILVGLCVGASIGLAQTVVLGAPAPKRIVWILGVALGFGAPHTFVVALAESWIAPVGNPLLRTAGVGVVAGAVGGVLQQAALGARRWRPWVVRGGALGLVLAVAFALPADPALGLLVGVGVYGLVGGALSIPLLSDGRPNAATADAS